MKKIYFGVAALAGLASVALASCGEDAKPTTQNPGETTTDVQPGTTTEVPEPQEGKHEDNTVDLTAALNTSDFSGTAEDKTIVFYHTMGDSLQETLKVAIDAFNAKYPDWTIEHSQIGGYNDVRSRCIAGLAAGNQPDLAYCYADHVAQYLKTGKVVDMSDYVNATGTLNGEAIGYSATEIADFVQGYYKEGFATNYGAYSDYGYKDGDILTFPFVKSTEVLYYNKDALKEAGITKVPSTWDKLIGVGDALIKKGYKSPMMGYSKDSSNCFMNTVAYPIFLSTLSKNSEALALANNLDPQAGPYMREALESVKYLVDSKIVDLDECDKISNNYNDVIMRFFEGDVPMMICNADTASGTKKREIKSEAFTKTPFKYSFAPIPMTDGGYFIDSPSVEFSVNKNCDNLEMTNEFMRFLISNKELNMISSTKGLVTPTKKISFDSLYVPFSKIPAKRIISPEVLGVKDPLAGQIKNASFRVGRAELTIEEAIAKYGSIA